MWNVECEMSFFHLVVWIAHLAGHEAVCHGHLLRALPVGIRAQKVQLQLEVRLRQTVAVLVPRLDGHHTRQNSTHPHMKSPHRYASSPHWHTNSPHTGM
eukprot:8036850-Pyramimonas_sp.AAC.1